MHKLLFVILSALFVSTQSAAAQGVTPDDVASAYVEAVTLCARAKVAGGGIAQLPQAERAGLSEAAPQMRAMARVPEGRPAWDVMPARGIVVISEPTDAECDVTAYGPRVRPVFERVAQALSSTGFAEVETQQDPSAILRAFERVEGERRIRVRLDGGEPGMPGRMSRFPVLVAFVSAN